MMFPFLGEEDLDILTSEVKIIDGIEQVRVYAESPDRTTGKFKKLEIYLPKDNIPLLEGYTEEEIKKHKGDHRRLQRCDLGYGKILL